MTKTGGNTIHGTKTRFGQLISQYLREIGMSEEVLDSGDLGTKAEKLAQIIWKYSLGFTEKRSQVIGGKEVETEVEMKPNLNFINLLYDRVEPPNKNAVDPGKETVAARVTEQGRSRIGQSIKLAL